MIKILRLKQLLVTAALLFSSIPSFAYDFEVDGIEYNVISLSDLTCEVSGAKNQNINIPASVDYKGRTFKVSCIAKNAFNSDNTLRDVYIFEGLDSICDQAFYRCHYLVSITIPNSVKSIGESAFEGCNSLSFVSLGDGITAIENNTFNACNSLSSIIIPNGVKSIGKNAFYNCTNLPSINIPNNVTEIDDYAFFNCSKLTSLNIPNSVKKIGESGFAWCSDVKYLKIGNGVEKIESNAFQLYDDLKHLTIGSDCYLSFPESKIDTLVLSEDYTGNKLNFISANNIIINTKKKIEIGLEESSITNSQYMDIEITVPKGMLDYYKSANIWKNFWSIKEAADDSNIGDKWCEAPTITYDNEAKKISFSSTTKGATFRYSIKCDDESSQTETKINKKLSGVYTIKAYTKAKGMIDSESTTVKLCWINAEVNDDTIDTNASRGVVVSNNGGNINISGTIEGETIEVLTLNGDSVKTVKAFDSQTPITGLNKNESYLIKIGGSVINVEL